MLKVKRAICWLRRDIRLSDHAPLAEACRRADEVAVLFVFDRRILDPLVDRDDSRVTFIHRSLAELDDGLRARGSRLLVAHGHPVEEVPAFAQRWGAEALFTGDDYEPHAQARDRAVAKELSALGCEFLSIKDHVVFHKDEVLNGFGEPFKVFTPFMKAWRFRLGPADYVEHRPDFSRLARFDETDERLHLPSLDRLGFSEGRPWLEPGEQAASARLESFLSKLPDYGKHRDMVSAEATSGLSAHLRFGTISVRECVRAALSRPSSESEK